MRVRKDDSVSLMRVCTRCGKPRIVLDSYEEMVESSVVTYTTTVCSDIECQRIVDKALSEEKRKRLIIKEEQEKRELNKRASMVQKGITLG